MKEVNYIPGDLVMTDGKPIGTKEGVVYVVTASNPNRTLTLKDGTVNKGVVTLDAVTEEDKAHFVETSTWVKHIVPIKLTPAISEALRRMKEGKKVKRTSWELQDGIWIEHGRICFKHRKGFPIPKLHHLDFLSVEHILATDWEEVSES